MFKCLICLKVFRSFPSKKRKLAQMGIKENILTAVRSSNELSDYITSIQAKSFPKLSSIELDDLRIPG